jgi:5-hydroxyisourate hydrolase
MSSISTHVLDTAHGSPAADVSVTLVTTQGDILFAGRTDADGRCKGLPEIASGQYRLTFEIAAYFAGKGVVLPDPPFLNVIAIDFGIADGTAHYHVPLLVSPFGYSTYRGS